MEPSNWQKTKRGHPHNGTWLSHKKNDVLIHWIIKKARGLDNKWKPTSKPHVEDFHVTWTHGIPFAGNVQNRQTMESEVGCWLLGPGCWRSVGRGVTVKMDKVSLWACENVIRVIEVVVTAYLCQCKNWQLHFKWANCRVCGLHDHKGIIYLHLENGTVTKKPNYIFCMFNKYQLSDYTKVFYDYFETILVHLNPTISLWCLFLRKCADFVQYNLKCPPDSTIFELNVGVCW